MIPPRKNKLQQRNRLGTVRNKLPEGLKQFYSLATSPFNLMQGRRFTRNVKPYLKHYSTTTGLGALRVNIGNMMFQLLKLRHMALNTTCCGQICSEERDTLEISNTEQQTRF